MAIKVVTKRTQEHKQDKNSARDKHIIHISMNGPVMAIYVMEVEKGSPQIQCTIPHGKDKTARRRNSC